jgi:hypothetical protein
MYTTTIGKTFLKAYNQANNTDYSARRFFEEIFVPLFFDHPKYMMTAGNSPLENPKLSWEDMILGKKPFETSERRKERIGKMLSKIETELADASIAVGYPVLDETAGTSGQITGMKLSEDKGNIYLSWIGAGLGIGVEGGITILFDQEQLLLDVFEGWQYYREYLNKYPMMKGNQINTWNGHWVAHRYDSYEFDKDDPVFGMNPLETMNNGLINIPTINWVKILLGIAGKYKEDTLVGYLYNIGQTNTTFGFTSFNLTEINQPNIFYQNIFGAPAFLNDRKKMEQLYGTAWGLRAACAMGAVGVQAMEPQGLKAYLPSTKGGKKIGIRENDEEQRITFNTYLIWILAMMNNEKLWDTSREFAQLLLDYEAGAGKARSNRANRVEQLLGSGSSKLFLQNLTSIVEETNEKQKFENFGKTVHLMPKDNFPYFNTLIRFQYALLNK